MSIQVVTKEDLAYAAQKQKEKFATKEIGKDLMTQAERDKLAGIAEGANKYVHPDKHSASDIEQDAGNRFVTDTEKTAWNAAKTHADSAHAPAGAQVNVIEAIKRNGTALTPSSKVVDINVPTKVSELSNDSSFQTASQVQTAINTAVSGVYKIKGSVAFSAIPAAGMVAGDVYNITNAFTTDAKFTEGAGKAYPAGTNVVYTTDSKWDCMAGVFDLSGYLLASDIVEIPKADIDAMYV